MKITICDVCKKEGKTTETQRRLSVKGHPDLRIDVCDMHSKQIQGKYPRITPEYVQYIYSLNDIEIELTTAKEMLQRKM